jgi:hypothetical protein
MNTFDPFSRPGARRQRPAKLLLALKRATVDTFDADRWRDLGYETETIDTIERDPRLLRSLGWGDSDYSSRILPVLEQMLDHGVDPHRLGREGVGLVCERVHS